MFGSRRRGYRFLVAALVIFASGSCGIADEAFKWFESWRLKGWVTYPFEKFEAGETPKACEAAFDGMRLARGESECMGLVLRGESPLRDVRIEVVQAGTELPLDHGGSVSVRRLG